MSELKWICKSFEELSVTELYDILRLRSEVFVVEQTCPYLDADNKDQQSFHLCGLAENRLVAYARLLPAGISYKEASIGRLATSLSFRKNGAGRELMQKAIAITLSRFDAHEIRIGAQLYLDKFYSALGFKQTSDVYLEDNIPHIEMLLTA